MRQRGVRPSSQRDSGQALLFALMFLALFGVWIASVLGLATNDLVGTVSVAKQRDVAFTADSAMYASIELAYKGFVTSSAAFESACKSGMFTYSANSIKGALTSVTVNCAYNETSTSPTVFDATFTATSASTTIVSATVVYYQNSSNVAQAPLISTWAD